MFSFFSFSKAAVMSTLIASVALAPVAQADTAELLPGVLVDRDHATMYLMAPDGGIEAVDIASGRVQWTNAEADKPLTVDNDLVFAQTQSNNPRELVVTSLERSTGLLRGAVRVPVPNHVFASVDDGLGSRFAVWAQDDRGQLELGWEHHPQRTSPLPPTPNEPRRTTLTGGARLNFETDSFVELATAPPKPQGPTAWSALDTGEHVIKGTGAQAVTTIAGHDRLALRSEGNSGLETVLRSGPYHLRLPSVDRRHLLVSRKDTSGSGYLYEVFSLETGRRLGEISARRSHARFIVMGDVMIMEEPTYAVRIDDEMVRQPRHVRAIDLNNGRERWQRPLRDTKYRGPRPQ